MGETEKVQPWDWVTAKRIPATSTVPVRGDADVAATSNATVPLPVPLAPDRMVIQLESEAAVQVHCALDARTTMVPLPPEGLKLAEDSWRLMSQSPPDWVTCAC